MDRNGEDRIELMAPAGGFDSMQAALDAGADSIYFGVEQLNMRAKSSINFTINDLKEISYRCRVKNVRTYLTLNTIIYDHDLSIIKTLLNQAKKAKITAVIASDQAVIHYAKTIGMQVHISTQLNITNVETIKFYSLFANTMVLSRELSLGQIKKIVDVIKRENIVAPNGKLIELEIFGHGALCMAISGKCYMSLHTQNASANRGACVQNCRRKYKVVDIEDGHELEIDNEYIMSPKDLCTLNFLDKVINTGIKVLKIEGRARSPEYVLRVIATYKEAIDAYYAGKFNQERVKNWIKKLETVYNRGFWSGYYLGQKIGEWADKPGSLATQKKIYVGKGIHYFSKAKIAHFRIESQSVKVGDNILIMGPTTGVIDTVLPPIKIDDKNYKKAERGNDITFKLDQKIRPSDKLYKLV